MEKLNNIIITGISGAGRSGALKFFEERGFYVIDHLPVVLIESALKALSDSHKKIIIGVDSWDKDFEQFVKTQKLNLVFLTANRETIVKRYAQTRRKHPLEHSNETLQDSITKDFECFNKIKKTIDEIIQLNNFNSGGSSIEYEQIDTSNLTDAQLCTVINEYITRKLNKEKGSVSNLQNLPMDICIQSFGFKHGHCQDYDLVFDARVLPNPYYVSNLKTQSGLDLDVQSFFEKHPLANSFVKQIGSFIDNFAHHYAKDRRSRLRVAVGCTGGQHRSVYVANELHELLKQKGYDVNCLHRDKHLWHKNNH